MAESVAFSLASKILSIVASPVFEKAYERGLSIWEARDELAKLRDTMETIQAVLLDAEKKQHGSVAIKNWIKRLKGVLYEAEDLFDEIATEDLLKQQIIKGKDKILLKKVRVSCSKLNPIISRNSIANKVKAIRKNLLEISKDMSQFGFVTGLNEESLFGRRIGQDPGSFIDPKNVLGRDEDKKAILEMLFNESNDAKPHVPIVIAIVGIGGMGKTTLAQLIYSDPEVKKNFVNRWFACISDTSDEKEVLGKVFQSICEKNYSNFTTSQLQTEIRKSVGDKKMLLVLDDVWDEDHGRWQHRMSLLEGVGKGSKIIVTTRSSSVARAVDAYETHTLGGLSEDASWDLFKRMAFTLEQENDQRWIDVGREIVKKCARVPLAIKSIGSLLYTKTTIREWESFKDQELSKIEEQSGHNHIMSVLKLSYDHLPSSMKHCFAICSLFPKDFEFSVPKLIYLWIAQGYIKSNEDIESVKEVGHSYFMSLLRRSFFQEAAVISGEIRHCKMHDLVHDLAQYVAGEEIVMLTASLPQNRSARHVHIGCEPSYAGEILPQEYYNMIRLRSFVLRVEGWVVDQQLRNCKWLRALDLSHVEIVNVPSCIGELKLLRYLDLSSNRFERLPDSITNLLNLLVLDLERCYNLKALPDNFRKLINLRYLSIWLCSELKHMPAGFGELRSLQYLSDFNVGKMEAASEQTGLDALSGLQLRGKLTITFGEGVEKEDYGGDECWQLPVSTQELWIENYPGMRIPHWSNNDPSLFNLVFMNLSDCYKVKYLPAFRHLPCLKVLRIFSLNELEYIEEGEEEDGHNCLTVAAAGSVNATLFFRCLESLDLWSMPKLKGWSRSDHQELLTFPLLSRLFILDCPELKYMPSSPRIINLCLKNTDGVLIEQLLSSSSPFLTEIYIGQCTRPTSIPVLHLASPHLLRVYIENCVGLVSVEVEAPAVCLYCFMIRGCSQLKNLRIPYPNIVEEFVITECPELELSSGVDWDSLPGLLMLQLVPFPPLEMLPECLIRRQALHRLQITDTYTGNNDFSFNLFFLRSFKAVLDGLEYIP